jgi:hypothetical protein
VPELTTPDGAPVELDAEKREAVNQEFARAMASDGPDEQAGPPRLDDKPAEAPKRPRGRPRKNPDDKPRVTDKPAAAASQTVDKDFTDECVGLTTLGWAALAATPYTSAYACVIEANQEQLVAALNAGAQNNAAIRAKIEAWSAGGGGVYMLQLAAVGTNMTVQAMQLLKDPDLRAQARAHTEGKFREFLRKQGVNIGEPADPTGQAEAEDARPTASA